MEKLKQNKVWITIVIFGVIIVGILLVMLNQQHQSSPEGQTSSYSSSAQSSSAAESKKDEANAKAFTKKAATMTGHVMSWGRSGYFTTWTKADFIKWANEYNNLSELDKRKASTNFGTSFTSKNDSLDTSLLDNIAKSVLSGDFKSIGYYETVKAFNADKKNSNVNPDDIKK